MSFVGSTWTGGAALAATCTVLGFVYERRRHSVTQSELADLQTQVDEVKKTSVAGTLGVDANHLDLAVAAALLASLGFVCALVYAVNHAKESARYISWEIISYTTALFAANMSWTAVDFVVGELVKDQGLQDTTIIVVDIVHFLVWCAVMHKVIVQWSVEMCQTKFKDRSTVYDAQAKVRSVAMLLSHIAAFAAICAGLRVQQLEVFDGMFQIAFVLLFSILLYFIFYLTDVYAAREEHHDELSFEVIQAECDKAENDIGSIAISFLLFRAVRHVFIHDWEDADAVKSVAGQDAYYPLKCLTCGGLILVVGVFVHLPMIKPKVEKPKLAKGKSAPQEELTVLQIHARRWQDIVFYGSITSFAWFGLSAGAWAVAQILAKCGIQIESDSALEMTCLAAITTSVGSGIILILDYFGYTHLEFSKESKNGVEHPVLYGFLEKHQVHLLVDGLIKALAILMGYSWVQAFEYCTITFAEATKQHGYHPYARVGIPIFLVGCIMLLFGQIIVRKVMQQKAELKLKSQ